MNARPILLAIAMAMLFLSAACTSGQDPGAAVESEIVALDVSLPARLLQLDVAKEQIAGRMGLVPANYAQAVALFSLRKAKLLQATLEIVRLRASVAPPSRAFQASIANQIGSVAPGRLNVGGHTVWLSTGTKQRIALWFDDDHMLVLAIRDDYSSWRSLIRRALAVQYD